ncbi:MAG: phosphoribosylamine--glycine ligase [Candidatus Omnitrophica bacterium]|nr:phosphoribosylamine--glycine ligase [Candidatus Omnitrophota bacterium]
MKVLVIGSGAREHALVWKIAQSPKVKKIFCAPGNGGISQIAECVAIKAEAIEQLLEFAQAKQIDLTVVGPEVPLSLGIVDIFQAKGLKIFGPSKSASALEASKVFAKNIMKKYKVPTADFAVFTNKEAALKYARNAKRPLVIKADGLCAGKGVFVCSDLAEQEKAIQSIFQDNVFGTAGNTVMIEECLFGQEASMIFISDGDNVCAMASSQDHKRIFDDDKGPNTGGMGAYSPAPVVSEDLFEQIKNEVIIPTIQGMQQEGMPFCGVLYAGIMITDKGPKVLEFNARFGDPETQAILPRLKTDLIDIILCALAGKLDEIELEWDKRCCVCIVAASGGYPGDYVKNRKISGLDKLSQEKDLFVFHAGTIKQGSDFLTAGGRVLGVTGLGKDIRQAIDTAYKGIKQISYDNMVYRKDIGKKALAKISV